MKNIPHKIKVLFVLVSFFISAFFIITLLISEEIKTTYLKNILVKFGLNHEIVLQQFQPKIKTNLIDSFYYKLKFTDIDLSSYLTEYYKNDLNPSGYMDSTQNSIIIVNSKGYFYEINPDDFFKSKDLDSIKILNSNLSEILNEQGYENLGVKIRNTVGIKDLLINENQIFISLVGSVFESCFNTSIYKANLKDENLNFKIFFKNNECVYPNTPHAAGGRMKIKDNSLIFTHGTYLNYKTFIYNENKVIEYSKNPAQDMNSIFGKILSINIDNPNDFKILSMGHRNPQGLYINKKGEVITSEHGPRGGDAINLIQSALQNNGWPCKSYGTSYKYGHSYNPEDIDIAIAEGQYYKDNESCLENKEVFNLPIYFFSPSIGASEIFQNNSSEYPLWESDIFITSLKAKRFFRLKYKNNKIISHETFKIGSRIRDLLYFDKAIYLLTESPRVSLIKIEN
jgi:hypothetical protein